MGGYRTPSSNWNLRHPLYGNGMIAARAKTPPATNRMMTMTGTKQQPGIITHSSLSGRHIQSPMRPYLLLRMYTHSAVLHNLLVTNDHTTQLRKSQDANRFTNTKSHPFLSDLLQKTILGYYKLLNITNLAKPTRNNKNKNNIV